MSCAKRFSRFIAHVKPAPPFFKKIKQIYFQSPSCASIPDWEGPLECDAQKKLTNSMIDFWNSGAAVFILWLSRFGQIQQENELDEDW